MQIHSVRLFAVALLISFSACKKDEPKPLRVAAAADLSLVFEELGKTYEQQTGQQVAFSFAASGVLSKQIIEGAPFDVFAAANVSFVEKAVAAGACDPATQQKYARGRLAVWSKNGPLELASLADEKVLHLAIANPETAPYGAAARAALTAAGLWEKVEARLVYGENVRQTLQMAQSGNADAALVAHALVIHSKEGGFTLVDAALHPPLEQALVICKAGGNRAGAEAFTKQVLSPEGQQLLQRYGFERLAPAQ